MPGRTNRRVVGKRDSVAMLAVEVAEGTGLRERSAPGPKSTLVLGCRWFGEVGRRVRKIDTCT